MINAVFIDSIRDFFNENRIASIIIDAYLLLFLVTFIVYFCIKFKKALFLTIIGALIIIFMWFSDIAGANISKGIYSYVFAGYFIIYVVLLAPELRRVMELHKGDTTATRSANLSTQATIEAIADAIFDMSAMKVGALITFEQQISLAQYSERAIPLNSDISKELLEQIFIKDSPLHDGGVIIRGNKIVCAAAYYTLTQDTSLDKTVGSRHRAGVGISEVTDSITIIVSEETGHVHLAMQGFMRPINTKNDLIEDLNNYLIKG